MRRAARSLGAGSWAPQGAIIDLILKKVWLFIYLCFSIWLVAPGRIGAQVLAFVLPSSEHIQLWGSFPSGICRKHLKAKVLARAAWVKDNCQDKQETDQKALIRKSLGKAIYGGMRVFKISCLSQGVEKTMHMPKTGYMFRKGLILTKDPKSSPLAGLQALRR